MSTTDPYKSSWRPSPRASLANARASGDSDGDHYDSGAATLDSHWRVQATETIHFAGTVRPAFHFVAPIRPIPLKSLAARLYSQFSVIDGSAHLAGLVREPQFLAILFRHVDSQIQCLDVLDRNGYSVEKNLQSLVLSPALRAALLQTWQQRSAMVCDSGAPSTESFTASPSQATTNASPPPRTCDEESRAFLSTLSRLSSVQEELPTTWQQAEGIATFPLEWVRGKLVFEVRETAVEHHFSNWGWLLHVRPDLCPPYYCRWSGQSGRTLAADEEGDISLSEVMCSCDVTQKRLHAFKMVECRNSGQRVARGHAIRSATTDDWLSPYHATLCRQCGVASPRVSMRRGLCRACHGLTPVRNLDASVQLECRWLLEQCQPRLGMAHVPDPESLAFYANAHFSWLQFRCEGARHQVVVDSATQIISHRVKSRWGWQWREAQPQKPT